MNKRTRWITGIFGALILLLGLGCFNYTKMGTIEHHSQFAAKYGLPPPSQRIVYLGMLLAPLGAGLVGFSVGRRPHVPPKSSKA